MGGCDSFKRSSKSLVNLDKEMVEKTVLWVTKSNDVAQVDANSWENVCYLDQCREYRILV